MQRLLIAMNTLKDGTNRSETLHFINWLNDNRIEVHICADGAKVFINFFQHRNNKFLILVTSEILKSYAMKKNTVHWW